MVQDLVDFGTLSFIFPKLDVEQIFDIINEYNRETGQKLPVSRKEKDITALDNSVKKLLYEVFVSRSLPSKFALKCRLNRGLSYFKTWADFKVKDIGMKIGDITIDIVLENSTDKSLLWVFFIEVMEEKFLKELRQKCMDSKKGTITNVPNKILIISSLSYRDISIDEPISLRSKEGAKFDEIPIELWIEEKNPNRPFRDEDLLLIDDIELAGFNFSSLDDLLDAIKQLRGKGQYQVFKVPNYFSKKTRVGSPMEKELIWKGILFPENFFND